MPRAHIVRRAPINDSFRVQQVRGMFDVPPSKDVVVEWDVNLPIEGKQWQIGVIVGPSGSGKTTIAGELFKDAYIHEGFDWPKDKSVLDGFPESVEGKSVTEALSSVGFSSPPHWLKSWHVLSNGQKFRAELARVLSHDAETVVFDEFTSVIDRDVAKVCCAAVSKVLRRRQRPRLVALSCHYDILDWLQPDWVYDVGTGRFESRSLQRRPAINLEIHKADPSAWSLFRGHHYLTADINKACRCFVATWDGRPVAFTAYLHFPHPKSRNLKRIHRTVVLPDFQGVGIGNALTEWLGTYLRGRGYRVTSVTSHPAMIAHRHRSRKWKVLREVSRVSRSRGPNTIFGSYRGSSNRLTATFEFVGGRDSSPRVVIDTRKGVD